MSATDELRRMLDERGAEHGDLESAPYPPYNSTRRITTFWVNKWVWQYIEDEREGGDIELEGRYMSMSVTPEQAIAATLGRGTCHDAGGRYSWGNWTCSECGFVMPSHFKLDELGGPLYRFCPNCGRKVVDE